jgi:hypothetical protein
MVCQRCQSGDRQKNLKILIREIYKKRAYTAPVKAHDNNKFLVKD